MDRLQAMETFTRVVEAGSFKRAAETLHVLPSTVTRTIKELEAHLGVQLLHRTTRALSITEAGLRYYDSSKAILREIEAAEGSVATETGGLRGTIRASMTPSLARHFIIPALPRFTARFPGIKVDLRLGDEVVDLIQQGVDCVLRAGELQASSLIVRRLGAFRWYVCGSPGYLEKNGEPAGFADLRDHVAVGYVGGRTGRSINWRFQDKGELHAVSMAEHVTVDDTDAYVAAGIAGLGLIRVASYMVRGPLAEGSLVRVLAELEAPKEPLSVLYPQSRHLSSAVRAFIDWCIEVIGTEAKSW